jgi:energy-coupling factor transport system ATP-binding protein
MPQALVTVEHLTYYYPDEAEPALRDVNLELPAGEFTLLLGPSGSGKSTLALALNGLIPHEVGGRIGGRVWVNGQDTRTQRVDTLATKVGLVFQDPEAQLCSLRVEDEVAFGPANLRLTASEVLARVTRSLRAVEVSGLRPKLIYDLSGGQKQRVAIAAVLAMEPQLLILDEPTAHLDPGAAVQLFALLRRLNREHGLTVLVIEHNVEAALPHADRLLLMERGTLVHSGPPRAVLAAEGPRLRSDLGLRLPPVAELALGLAARGVPLEPFPLTVAEAAEALWARRDAIQFAPRAGQGPAAADSEAASEKQVADSKEPVIVTEQLSFTYPDGTAAVSEVSLSVGRGEVVGLVGENGSGKTTLTALLLALHRPTAGRGWVAGLDLKTATTPQLAAKAGYVFQYPEHQFVTDRVEAEIAFGLKAQRRPAAEVQARVAEMLRLFGLEEVRGKHPLRLSMGQKRRLSVATMLVLDPELLILDEPTTGQDQRHTDTLLAQLRRVNAQGTTLIVVTHDINLAMEYCTRLVVMEAGRVAFSGPPEVYAHLPPVSGRAVPEMHTLTQALRARGWLGVPAALTPSALLAAVRTPAGGG